MIAELHREVDQAEERLPATRLRDSRTLGWQSVVARTYREQPHADGFETMPTRSLLLVCVTSGTYAIESRDAGSWHAAVYRRGSIGATAPGLSSTLRWRSVTPAPMTSLHLYLHATLFAGPGDSSGSDSSSTPLPDQLVVDDPTLWATACALHSALENGSSALYADSAAQFVAAHLLHGGIPRFARRGSTGGLATKPLDDVCAYMHAHLAEDITLDQLSRLARLSKYHFLRSFSRTTGSTPHQFLTDLRIERAAELLRSSRQSIAAIATMCGYRNSGHFAAAFRKRMHDTPARYRFAHQDTVGRLDDEV